MSKKEKRIRRGDVILLNFPLITDYSQSKLRPAVVIQNDSGNRFSSNLIVAAISSKIPRKDYPMTHIIRRDTSASESAGLDRDSVVLGQVILTIPKSSIVRLIGHFDRETMKAVDACLRVSLHI